MGRMQSLFGGILTIHCFCHAEVNMCVHKGWNYTTEMTELQMKFVNGDYIKITVWWGRNDTFDRRGCTFIKEDFPDRENE